MALKDCLDEENLNILTDSLSDMVLLQSMQRKDLPLGSIDTQLASCCSIQLSL